MYKSDGICLTSLPPQQTYPSRSMGADYFQPLRTIYPPAAPAFTAPTWTLNSSTRRKPLDEKTTQLSSHLASLKMPAPHLARNRDENTANSTNGCSLGRNHQEWGPGLVQYTREQDPSSPAYKRRRVYNLLDKPMNAESESEFAPKIAGNALQSWRLTGAHFHSPSAPVKSIGAYAPGQKHTKTHTTTVAFDSVPRPRASALQVPVSPARHRQEKPHSVEKEVFPSLRHDHSTSVMIENPHAQDIHTHLYQRRNPVRPPPAPLKLFPSSPSASFTTHASPYSNSSTASNLVSQNSPSTSKSTAATLATENYSPLHCTVRASLFLRPQKSVFEDDDSDAEDADEDSVGFVGMFKRSLELTRRKRKRSSTVESQKPLRAASIQGKSPKAGWRWSKLICGGNDNQPDSDED
jgi:hypothetical protein